MAQPSSGPRPPSRFVRRGRNADPSTRIDESTAFDHAEVWRPPEWFDRIAVVLYETNDAVNIGSVVRAMANTGFRQLRLVNPAPFDPWDVVGVAHYTQHIVEGAARFDALSDALRDAEYVVCLSGKHHRARRNRVLLREANDEIARRAGAGERVAVVFGREDTGLPNDALDLCQQVVTIPTNPAHPSLNLAQAALLVLYGLFERAAGGDQAVRLPRRRAPAAPAELLEDLFADAARALEAVEFFKTRSRTSIMRSLRSALFRARLDVREASLLRAMALEVRRYLVRTGVAPEVGPVGRAPERDAPPEEQS